MKSVIIDIDGVLADFPLGFTRLASSKIFNFDVIPTPAISHQQWNFKNIMTHKQEDDIWDYINLNPWWWATLPPLIDRDMGARLSDLNQAVPIYYVTHRPNRAHQATSAWLRTTVNIAYSNVIMSKYKGEVARLLEATHAIDDKMENCQCIHWISDRPQTKVYVLDRPYNRMPSDVSGIARIEQFSQFVDDLEQAYL